MACVWAVIGDSRCSRTDFTITLNILDLVNVLYIAPFKPSLFTYKI